MSPSRLIKLIALLVIGLISFVSVSSVFAQQPPAVSFQRNISPTTVPFGQGELTVTLTVTGNSTPCGTQITRKPLDIVLVIDRSSSMGSILGGLLPVATGDTKLDNAKAAAKIFLSKVNLGQDRVAIVEFNEIANVARSLDTDRPSLEKAMDSLTPYDGTAINAGIEVSRQELTGARRRAEASMVIVLLSDGGSDENAAVRAADTAKKDGIRLITIGLGTDANQNLLRNVASDQKDYYYAPDTNALTGIYTTIAESVKQFVAATNLTLKHNFDATAFQLVPNSISPTPSTATGNTITWKLDSLGDAKQAFSYRLKPVAPGRYNVDQGDSISFAECEKNPTTISEQAGLPVVVQAPTPTPTRPPTATPLPTPTPTPPPTLGETMQNTICDSLSLPLWLLCLTPLLLLFLIWFIRRMWQELHKPRKEQNPCPLVWWLLLPLILILLYQILSTLLNVSCMGGESVYFWRIDSGGGSGIFVSSKDGTRPAQSFNEVNQGGRCVACHAVSSTSRRIAAVTGGGVGPVVAYSLDGKPIKIPSVTGSFLNWSPDGKKLAVSTSDRKIVIVDIDAGTITPLAGASEDGVAQLMPAWSPDGATVAFVRSTDPSGTFRLDASSNIYTVPSAGGVAQPLPGASGKGFNYYPAYSPDGRWLAFTHHISGTTTYSDPYAEVFLVPASGGTPIRLAANDAPDGKSLTQVSNSWTTWSRDGQWLAFNSKRNNKQYDIFLTQINADGTSGPATLLRSAADPNAFEHLPFWGEPPNVDPIARLLDLWPWLIPFLLVPLLYFLCRWLHRVEKEEIVEVPATPIRLPPGPLPPLHLNPTWQVAPTLLIGVGGTGRWVLTHLKKSLRDGGVGKLPQGVRFALLDTSEEEAHAFVDATGKPQAVEFAGVRLEPAEMFLFQDNLESVIRALKANAAADPALRGWFPTETYAQLPAGQTSLANGTRGRRPLARAGLVKKLQAEADRAQLLVSAAAPPEAMTSVMLWELLKNGARQSLDNRQVRVILVGSLAGGMSGVLFDLAHLARLAGQSVIPTGGTVTVEGYFATAGAFNQVGGNTNQRQVNTFAASRELQRFQLSQGWPYMMRYRAEDKTPLKDVLENICDRQVFEDVYLFGAGGQPETNAGKENQPWATTFATMSDAIAFRLDRGVRAEMKDYREDVRQQSATRQQQQNVAFVSGAGSFVYRLPMYDIVEQIKTRWARQLLHEFIYGTETTPSSDKVQADARRFFQGEKDFFREGYCLGSRPEGMDTIDTLTYDDRAKAFDSGGTRPIYRDYLQHAVGLILNDAKASKATPRNRVNYAVQFLEQVSARLEQFAHRAGEAEETAKPKLQSDYTRVKNVATQWDKDTRVVLEQLRQQRLLLEGGIPAPGQLPIIGAYQEIANRETEVRNRRTQMDRVAVREYLWWRAGDPGQLLTDPKNQIDLADEWYHLKADQHVQEYFERLYWEFTPEGAPKLSLITYEGQPVTLGPDAPEAFVRELLRLGDHVVREIWEGVSLAEVMRGRQLIESRDQAIQTTTRMWGAATPHLQSKQNTKSWNAALGLPSALRDSTKELVNIFATLGGVEQQIAGSMNPCATSIVQYTDQYAAILVRTLDLVSVADISEMEDARRMYEQSLRGTIQGVEGAELQTVFAAERRALAYEKRLPDPNLYRLPVRQFHPLVVMALENEERARLFALAYAANWIRVPDQAGSITLAIPGSNAETIAERNPDVKLAGEVTGILDFCQRAESRFVDAVRNATTNPADNTLNAWREYYSLWKEWKGKPPEADKPQELQDLAMFAALVVYDTLKARTGR